METLRKARWIAWAVFLASLVGGFVLPAGEWRVVAWLLWLGSIVALVVIRVRMRKLQGVPARTERGLRFVSVAALAWAGVDALFFGQGVVAFIVMAVGLLYLLPRAFGARRDRALLGLRLAKAGVTIAAGAAAIGTIALSNRIAADRAKEVIAAVEGFNSRYGRYPDRLDELVPAFLPAVPRAKPFSMLGEFRYWSSPPDGRHTLMYVAFPPYGRRLYHFEGQRWSALD